jgi:hypothetical protein
MCAFNTWEDCPILGGRKLGHTLNRYLSYLLGLIRAVDEADYPPLGCLRQQTPNTISHVFLFLRMHRAHYGLCANRTRLPDLDKETIKVQPLPVTRFSNSSPDVGEDLGDGQVVRDVNRNLLKILMFWCDGLERGDDPFDAPRI